MKTYYDILGLENNCTSEEIKKKYRELSKKYHPDLNKNDKLYEEKFIEIKLAYETLIDEEKRFNYNVQLGLMYAKAFETSRDTEIDETEINDDDSDVEDNWFKEKEILDSEIILTCGKEPDFPYWSFIFILIPVAGWIIFFFIWAAHEEEKEKYNACKNAIEILHHSKNSKSK